MQISRYVADPLFSKDDWVATFTTTDTDVKWENDLSTNQYILSSYTPSTHTPSTHFNCPFCGAPNQIDVCEYCGSADEGE